MNYFLMLIILGLGCGGYYEYTTLQQQHAGDAQMVADLQAKLDPLTADNQKLAADNVQLKKGVTDAQTEIADLTQQLQAAQGKLAQEQQKTVPPTVASTPATTSPAGNNLGNIATLDGRSYSGCTLLKVQPTCIVVSESTGITQILYAVMPPDLQKRFGYDAHVAPSLSDAQVEALEDQRQAAAQTAGN